VSTAAENSGLEWAFRPTSKTARGIGSSGAAYSSARFGRSQRAASSTEIPFRRA
jgi:hypothetical protein